MSAFKKCLQKPFLSSCFALQQVRYYPRWSHRRPVRVYSPEEYEALQKNQTQWREHTNPLPHSMMAQQSSESLERMTRSKEVEEDLQVEDFGFERIVKPKTANLRKPINKKPVQTVDMLETVIDAEGNFVYTKMGNKDSRIT